MRLVTQSHELGSIRSRILPLMCVDWSNNWINELLKTKSQKVLDEGEVDESVSHWTSCKLKSPTIMVSVDGFA